LTCGLLVATAAPLLASARTEDATDARVEAAILQEDWQAVAGLLGSQHQLPPEARLILGHAYLALNRNNESLCLFLSVSAPEELKKWRGWMEALAAGHPTSAIAHYLAGDAAARLEQWPAALAEFDRALELHPGAALALNARGVVRAIQGRWNEAVVDLDDATGAKPGLADAYASRGALNIQRSSGARGALGAFDGALKISPGFLLAINGRAAVRTALHQWDQAEADLAQVRSQAQGCLAATAGIVAGNEAALAREKTDAVSRALAEVAQLEPGMNMNRVTQIADQLRGDPGKIAQIKGALMQQNGWTSLWNANAADRSTAISNIQGNLSGKLVGAGTMPLYAAQGNLKIDSQSIVERSPRATAMQQNAWRSQVLEKLDQMYPDIKAQAVGPLGGWNVAHQYPELSNSLNGGVRTAGLASSHLDRGNWNVVTVYGLLYNTKTAATAAQE